MKKQRLCVKLIISRVLLFAGLFVPISIFGCAHPGPSFYIISGGNAT